MKRTVLILFSLLFVNFAFGQIPQGINYQAVARDANGDPMSEIDLTIRISIYQDEAVVWMEEHQVSTNKLGLYSLVIGDRTATGSGSAGSFDNIDWGTGAYSIGTEVDPGTGFIDLGIAPLQSVPYALYAGKSEDGDQDPSNEIQDLSYTNGSLTLSGDPTPEAINLQSVIAGELGWEKMGDTVYTTNSVKINTLDPQVDVPLFEVKNDLGIPVFAVYNDGVMVYVDENKKGVKGGFAVGGYRNTSKGFVTQEYLRVTPDSVRIYVQEDTLAKGVKGGFAVGGYRNTAKGPVQDYLYITPDSIRMYVPNMENDSGYVGLQGGFAVNTFDPVLGQDSPKEYIMGVNRGITRFNTSDNSKGFTIGSQGEGWGSSYMQLTPVNTFVGFESGINNIVATSAWEQKLGTYNIFMGYRAGKNNTDGASNLFIGNYAGYNQIGSVDFESKIGFNNIFIGDSAGYNLEGSDNLLLGRKAGYGSLNGSGNLFIGSYAGRSAQSNDNIVIGNISGTGLAGTGITVVGDHAGTDISGSHNTILGSYAGSTSVPGDANTFLGASAGLASTDGSNNLFAGYYSGFYASGNNNVFLGDFAGYNNSYGSGNIFIGHYAGYTLNTDNQLVIENSASSTPLIQGDFTNDRLTFNASVSINTPTNNVYKLQVMDDRPSDDLAAIYGHDTGTPYFGIGVQGDGGYIGVVGNANVTGEGSRFGIYGTASGGTTFNYGVYGYAYNISGTNYGIYGYASGGSASYAVYAAGNLAYTGSLINASDRKLKKDVENISPVMENLMRVSPRSYSFTDNSETKSMNLPSGKHYGFVAQELEAIYPELVVEVTQPGVETTKGESKGKGFTYKGVKYMELIPILLKGMQEQQEEIELLKRRITELEGQRVN